MKNLRRRSALLTIASLCLSMGAVGPAYAVGTTVGAIAITLDDASVTYGTAVTATATATPSDMSGDVTFYRDGVMLGTCTLIAGACTETFSDSVANTAGDSDYSITGSYPGDTEYAALTTTEVVSDTLVVSPAALTADAVADEKDYGDADPTFDFTLNGLQLSDTAATVTGITGITCTRNTANEAPATYADDLRCDTTGATTTNTNYVFFAGIGATADFVIHPRPITITIADDTKVYGDTFTPDPLGWSLTDGTLADSSGVGADVITSGGVLLDSVPLTGALSGDPVNIYNDVLVQDTFVIESSASVDVTANYDFTFVPGDLEVTTREIEVTADDDSKTFGDVYVPDDMAYSITSGTLASSDGTNQDAMALTMTLPDSPSGEAANAPVGTYTLRPSSVSIVDGSEGDVTSNYDITIMDGTLTVDPFDLQPTDPWFTGQRTYITSSRSSTTAKVLLSATVNADLPGDEATDCAGTSVATSFVTFTDADSGRVLARNVPIAEVGGNCEEGIASTFATLSAGSDGTTLYTVMVTVSGDMSGSNWGPGHQSDLDLDSMQITVQLPLTSAGMTSTGGLDYLSNVSATNLGTEGTLASAMVTGDVATYTAYFTTATKTVKAKGRAEIRIPGADGGRYIIRTNAVNSVITSGGNVGTVYAKASISWQAAECTTPSCWIAIDGNASLRLDVYETPQRVGFTVLSSKNSALLYSNNWQKPVKSWVTVLQVPSGAITTVI